MFIPNSITVLTLSIPSLTTSFHLNSSSHYLIPVYITMLYMCTCSCSSSSAIHSCMLEIQVTSSRGGMWQFPLHLLATSADPDDAITVEAQGLNKETQVEFRLTSLAE